MPRGRKGGLQKKIEGQVLEILVNGGKKYSVESLAQEYPQFANQQIYLAFKALFDQKKVNFTKNGRTKLYFSLKEGEEQKPYEKPVSKYPVRVSESAEDSGVENFSDQPAPSIPRVKSLDSGCIIQLKPEYINGALPKSICQQLVVKPLNELAQKIVEQYGASFHASAMDGKDYLVSSNTGGFGGWITTDMNKQASMPLVLLA